MKVLVIGKNGQLGRSIQNLVEENNLTELFDFVGRDDLDLNNSKNISQYFKNNIFDIVINCAAYTFVDKAEEERETANQINHLALSQLAEIAMDQKTKLIHISSDYVFNGNQANPYKETDDTDPINFYGLTKLNGEKEIQKLMPINAIIIRAGWIYSEYGNNFVKTMLRLGKEKNNIDIVVDQIGSPTYAKDLANLILKIITDINYLRKSNPTEIYHFSNQGEVSWYEFAKEIFKMSNINCLINPIKSKQYPTLAARPRYSVMDKKKIIENLDVKLIEWKSSLKECLKSEL